MDLKRIWSQKLNRNPGTDLFFFFFGLNLISSKKLVQKIFFFLHQIQAKNGPNPSEDLALFFWSSPNLRHKTVSIPSVNCFSLVSHLRNSPPLQIPGYAPEILGRCFYIIFAKFWLLVSRCVIIFVSNQFKKQ